MQANTGKKYPTLNEIGVERRKDPNQDSKVYTEQESSYVNKTKLAPTEPHQLKHSSMNLKWCNCPQIVLKKMPIWVATGPFYP